jgi:nitrate reductase NapAB chaperone NapD
LKNNVWKICELVIDTEKEKAHEVARRFLRKYKDNARNILTKVDSKSCVIGSFVYSYPQELQDIVQDVSNIPYVKKCRIK